MNFDDYDLYPAICDEMFLPDGAPREHSRRLYETLTQLCRVALRRGSLAVNSSQGGGGKDFWVLED